MIALGWVFVVIGLIGAVLPLLPTTPFLILAAACFARGSERFYRWLLSSRLFGPVIREWRQTRSVARWAKRTALVLIALTFGSTVAFFAPNDVIRIIVASLGLIALVAVARLRVRDPDPRSPADADFRGAECDGSRGP